MQGWSLRVLLRVLDLRLECQNKNFLGVAVWIDAIYSAQVLHQSWQSVVPPGTHLQQETFVNTASEIFYSYIHNIPPTVINSVASNLPIGIATPPELPLHIHAYLVVMQKFSQLLRQHRCAGVTSREAVTWALNEY